MSKQKAQQPDLNRRRILRGMATAPVVMTLGDAHAQAVASNLACIGKNADILQADVVADPNITQTLPDTRWCAPLESLDATIPPDPVPFYTDAPASTALMTTTGAPDGSACVVYVDQTGTMQSLIPTDGSPVAASCYASFV